jgi:hypothetical protein
MMENLQLYNAVKSVPQDAIKPITGGRLKGMSDINPMWRIKTLTEQFGPCGIGWKYVIKDKRLEMGANGEVAAFLDIDLFHRYNGEWSEAIPGTGGSSFIKKETTGLYVNDECFKMALTDAISVSCKALGIGADVWWNSDNTKYVDEDKQDQSHKPSLNENNGSESLQSAMNDAETNKKATKKHIDALVEKARDKGMEGPSYWEYLKHLSDLGKISSQFAYGKDKKIQWTMKDFKEIDEDLDLPF